MEVADAAALIKNNRLTTEGTWADLGCGNGTFTFALADLLPPSSIIYGIDKNEMVLQSIPDSRNGITINKKVHDFITQGLPIQQLDGILMANALHFVEDKKTFLQSILPALKPTAAFIIVEYEMTSANPWVPFPIPLRQLQNLFVTIGFDRVTKISQRPSIYHQATIYAALITKSIL